MLRIGIDLGGTKTEGIVMDATGRVLERERRLTPQQEGYAAILADLCRLVRDLERRAGQTCQVGICTPGAISTRTGCLKNSNTVCLNGNPIHTDLARLLARPIRIANDANCFALSEARDGAAIGVPVVFGVIMGTGVGGGIVVDGGLVEGLQHIAGEWGHNVLEPDGPLCYCGRRGCVESLLSGPGLIRDYAAQGSANVGRSQPPAMSRDAQVPRAQDVQERPSRDTRTSRYSAGNDRMSGATAVHGRDAALDAQAIVARAAQGDSIAEAAMQRFLDRFGRALATVINILDPHIVVLGGGMSNIERLYTDGREAVAHHVFNDELRTRIVRNLHGDSSGVRGAAQLWEPGE